MNKQNRPTHRFTLHLRTILIILGSVLIATALVLVLVNRTVPETRISFIKIDAVIQAWNGQQNPDYILKQLETLQNKRMGSTSALSLLKRYRSLAAKEGLFASKWQLEEVYADKSIEFYRQFPEQVELLSFLFESFSQLPRPLSETEQELLVRLDPRQLNENNLPLLLLVLNKAHFLESPEQFLRLPYGAYLAEDAVRFFKDNQGAAETFMINRIITHALSGNIQAALAVSGTMYNTTASPDEDTCAPGIRKQLLTAGILHGFLQYDFGSSLDASRLFHTLYEQTGQYEYLLHEADAYLKADLFPQAITIWQQIFEKLPEEDQALLLYNLGSASTVDTERQNYFGQLLQLNPLHEYGLIQYSRMFSDKEAREILQESRLYSNSPLLQLESVRLEVRQTPSAFKTGPVWTLLNRFPGDPRLYTWAAWYFFKIGDMTELEKLLFMANENKIDDPAILLYCSFIQIEKGDLTAAENNLTNGLTQSWCIPANLALIYEHTYRIPEAIEYYQLAASLTKNPELRSQLYFHIGNCFDKLDKRSEARRSYEYALQLNPDIIQAAFELRRLSQ